MRNRKFAMLRALAVLLTVFTMACESDATPTVPAPATSSSLPKVEATVTPGSTSPPASEAPEPTDTPAALSTPTSSQGGNADVLFVRAVLATNGTWTFHVTVEHPDSGWEDYADGWDVVTPDGDVLKPDADSPFTRLLLHPHENEQPFTRSQSGIVIPAGVTQVRVRAHDLVDGYGGREVLVDLTEGSGPDFEVERQ